MHRVIIGLGNPGPRFLKTRHNAGFLLIDALVSLWKARPRVETDLYQIWDAETHAQNVTLMKPMTYMNLSGHAVVAYLRDRPCEQENLMIAYDDVALPLGRLRLRPSGSAGGQKGMRHIIDMLGSKDIPRLRLGVGGPRGDQESLADFVLQPVLGEDARLFEDMIATASQALGRWLTEPFESVMGRFNAKHNGPEQDHPEQSQLPGEEKVD